MKRYAQKLSKWLYIQGTIEESDVELYEYGAYVLLINVSPLLLSLVIGSAMDLTLNGIIFIMPFILIRKFSGGFHAKSSRVCFVLSVLIISFGIWLTGKMHSSILMHVFVLISLFSLIVLSPIDSENRRLEVAEKRIYKYIASVLSIIFGAIYVILCLVGESNYATCIALGIILSSGLQMIYLVENIWREMSIIDQKSEK